ncbi:MAG: hypothetical protein AAF963_01695 [Bacteroidota bacterium]
MEAEHLLRLLHHPHKTTPEDISKLRDLLRRYPYFQVGYALLAKAAHDQDRATAGPIIQLAAIHATNRPHLKAFLEDTPPFTAPASTSYEDIAPVHVEEEQQQAPTDDYDAINGYINAIRQRSKRPITKQKSLAQLNIIQDFMQKDVPFKPRPLQAMPDEDFYLDLTQNSTAFHEDLATETLARVLIQQGKLARALDIYTQLSLKFPEKKAYFASLIEELKSQR